MTGERLDIKAQVDVERIVRFAGMSQARQAAARTA